MIPILDGHNDALLRLYIGNGDPVEAFLDGGGSGHVDLPRARAGGFAGGFFAVFAPGPGTSSMEDDVVRYEGGYEVPMAPPIDPAEALELTTGMTTLLFEIEAASDGQVVVMRTVDDIARCLQEDALAAILHFEGAAAIDPELTTLDQWYETGLRSLGLVWSRPNAFGVGVPFMFPHSPDTGPGLTDAGRDLVRACNELGVLVDLSHLNEAGFWDVAALSDAPLVATHSNAHALCPVTRNLTDRQLDAIAESDGMVGVCFDVSMLLADSALDEDAPLTEIVRHIDYLVERIGIDRVGFGSDFDGTTVPQALGDAAGMQQLIELLGAHGYDELALRKLAHENWLHVLRKTWRS